MEATLIIGQFFTIIGEVANIITIWSSPTPVQVSEPPKQEIIQTMPTTQTTIETKANDANQTKTNEKTN